MKKQRIKKINLIGWQTDLLMIVGGTRKAAYEAYMKEWNLPAGGYVEPKTGVDPDGSFFNWPTGRACAIWIPCTPRTPSDYGTVAHEALHAACHILSRCDVEYTTHTDREDGHRWVNDEPWTYLTGSIVEELVRFAREK